MPASFYINRRPPPSGGTTFPINISDTGAANTDTIALRTARGVADTGATSTDAVQLKTGRVLSDTGVAMSDTVAHTAGRVLSDTGVANSDTLQLRTARALTDTGVTNTDSLTRKAARPLSDQGVTNTDTVQLRTSRIVSDTGVTNTDSVGIVKGPARAVSDTGTTNTDTVQLRTTRVLTDTGVSVTDTILRRVNRPLADPGVTQTDSVTTQRGFGRPIADTGVTVADTITTTRTRVLADTGVTVTDSLTRRVSRVVSDTGVTTTDSLVVTRKRVFTDTGTAMTDTVVITVVHPAGPATLTPLTGYVYGTPASGTIRPQGDTGLVIVSLRGVTTPAGDTGYPGWAFPASKVCVLGYSNQLLGGVVVGDVETLIGRQFHGLRQNQQYTTTGIGTAITEYDAGRTTQYRAIQFDAIGWAAAASGSADAQMTTFANLVMANPTRWNPTNPFIVCLHHEASVDMNGGGSGKNLGTAQDRINMWRHIRDVWDAMGATVRSKTGVFLGGPLQLADVGWDRMFVGANGVGPPTAGQGVDDFDPDRGSSPAPAGTSYYELGPGCDVYNDSDAPGTLRYGLNAATLLEPIRQAAAARGKDWMIGEMACVDGATQADHANKQAWLDSLRVYLDGLGASGPGVCRVLMTTIKADASNYQVDSSPESVLAWQRLGHDAYYS